jgi:hypothetical protein
MTALISLLGGGLGALLRFVPEIFKLFAEQKDRDHEFRMTQLQLEIDRARATQQLDLVHAQGELAVQAGEMDAYIEAIKAQQQPSGVRWVDAMNASVRPVITYWWMALMSVYKLVMFVIASIEIYVALQAAHSLAETAPLLGAFVNKVWTPDDAAILAMILGFWFVDRSIRKNSGK